MDTCPRLLEISSRCLCGSPLQSRTLHVAPYPYHNPVVIPEVMMQSFLPTPFLETDLDLFKLAPTGSYPCLRWLYRHHSPRQSKCSFETRSCLMQPGGGDPRAFHLDGTRFESRKLGAVDCSSRPVRWDLSLIFGSARS